MHTELSERSGYHVEIVYDNARDLRMVLAAALFGPAGYAASTSARNIKRLCSLGEWPDGPGALRDAVQEYLDVLDTGDPYRSFWIATTGNHYMSCLQFSEPKGSWMLAADGMQQRVDEILAAYDGGDR